MKIYRVLVRRPLFNNCGSLQAENVCFKSKTLALNWAKKKARKKEENYLIRVEEFILKKLDMDNLLFAFNNEDIMDLVIKQNEIKVFKHDVDTTRRP